MVATYCRLLDTVLRNTGFLPLGAERIIADRENSKSSDSRRNRSRRGGRSKRHRQTEKPAEEIDLESGAVIEGRDGANQQDSLSLEWFYNKDVYVCQEDGRPPYCSKCCQFKTDRAHHCREVDRCVRKMDHFCPWYVDGLC